MLKAPIRIAPQWKNLKGQLLEKLELQKSLPESTEATHILLSDRPTIIFRASCFPSLMPLICFYPANNMSYFASFTWRIAKGNKNKVRVWIYNMEEEVPVVEKDYVLVEDPKVLTIIYIPCQHLFVTYCEDIHIRLFSDHQEDVTLLSKVISPYLITSMCYNHETKELVTGTIGMLAFWSFEEDKRCALSVIHEVRLTGGEFVHALSVEREGRVLVALCEHIIRAFDYQTKAEMRTFQVSQGVSLTCTSANWLQSFLYAGDLAGDVKVWNFDTGSQINQFKAHQSAISSVVSRISVHTLMTASLDGLLKEWNLTTCELLRRVDIGEPVFQMQFISEQTFFIRTQYTISIRTLNNFYQLFNRTKSGLKKLARVQCGPEKARILATTEDGVTRFLSPVTGEMLFVTWPFQFLDKALDYVYDPDREELLVTMGTADIYVLDTSQNPCPTKYILHCTDNVDDRVLCLAYSRLDLGNHTFSFIFSGYKSGRVRSVTQHLFRMGGRKLHDGRVMALSSISASGNLSYHSRESSYLCSYGADEYIILSDVALKRNGLLDLVPLVVIPSPKCRINHLLLIPGYICVLTEQNRVRLWRQAALVPGKKNPFWKESDALHPTTITSFDYCYNLNMLVTGGADGSVRIWDILGQLLVEFDTSLKFSRVCFANQRGDLVVGGNKNIYFIPCVTYLPSKYLKSLSTQSVSDDLIENPLPFLPCFLLSFNIVFVPKYRQVGKQAKKYESLEPVTNSKEVVMEKNVAKVMEFAGKESIVLPGPNFYEAEPTFKERPPEFAIEYQVMPQVFKPLWTERRPTQAEPPMPLPLRELPPLTKSVPLYRRVAFKPGRTWPIAPDGYVPNSVIRAQLFPKGTPPDLWCSLRTTRHALPVRKVVKIKLAEDDKTLRQEKARKKKAPKLKRPSLAEGQHRRDLLAEIVSKPWLRHKPSDMTLPCITKAILDLMDDVPYSTYVLCSSALVQIAESYELSPEIQEVAFNRLIQDTDHKEVRMRLAAWEALGKMDLLTEKDVVPLARALLDENKKVRDLARSLLDSVAGITDKFVLKQEMQRLAETSLEDLSQLAAPEGYFPRRVRAAGIVAETQDEAVYELTEGARRLMNRVDSLLTANLFLTTEVPPLESRKGARLPAMRRKFLTSKPSGDADEDAKPETHGGAQARWLGLFGKDEKKGKYPEGGKHAKMPKIQPSRIRSGSAPTRSSERLLPESPSPSLSPSLASSPSPSSPSSIGSSISSGSTWEEVMKARKALLGKEKKRPPSKAPHPQEAQKRPKVGKLAHPALLQRRDTRTQLYTEMLKHQYVRKEKLAVEKGEAEKGEKEALPLRPSETGLPSLPPISPKGSLIDPKQRYSLDKAKWRSDLYKLLMLRISPSFEGRTAAEDFLASAQMALGGRSMSWELLTSFGQSLLGGPEKGPQDAASWKRYLERLLRPPVKDEMGRDQFSQGRMLAMRERYPGSKSGTEDTSVSMEDLAWELAESDEEAGAAAKPTPGKGRREEMMSGRERKKILRKRERGMGREAKPTKLKEQAVPVSMESELLSDGREWEEILAKAQPEAVGKVPTVFRARKKERELIRIREGEAALAKEPEMVRAREREVVAREREMARVKEEAVARQREPEVAAKKSRVAFRRRVPSEEPPVKKAAKKPSGLKKEEVVEEAAAKMRREVDEWAVAWERALKETASGVVAQVVQKSLIQLRKSRLAEAREKALAKVLDRAKVEAGELALDRVKEIAKALLKEKALEEVKAEALEDAEKVAIVEARAKLLAEARQALLAEVRVRALAEAQAQVLGEGLEGVRAAARIKELAETRAAALAEARALQMIQGMEITPDESRILELAAKAMEVAEDRALQLAEERLMEMDEKRIWELVQPKMEELARARAREQAEAKLRKLEEEEERIRMADLEAQLKKESLEAQMKKEALELQLKKEGLEELLGKQGFEALLLKESLEVQLGKEGLDTLLIKEGLEVLLGKEGLEALLSREGLDVQLGKEGLEALIKKEGLEALLRKEGLDIQLGKEGLEALVKKEGLEALIGKEGMEALLGKEGLAALLQKEGLEALIRKEGLEALLRKEGLQALLQRLEELIGKEALQALLQSGGLEALLRKEGLEALLRKEGLEVSLGQELLEILLGKEGAEALLSPEEKAERERERLERERLERERLEGEQRPSLSSEEEGAAADLWEDLGEEDEWVYEDEWPFSTEEKEGLLSILEEVKVPGAELDFATRAQLILDLLAGPDKLDISDSEFQKRLFQVVSLLQISPAMDAEGLAEALLQKARELLQEGEAKQLDFSEMSTGIMTGLREAVKAHRRWDAEPRAFAARMRALLKTALAVLRAKSTKERLRAEVYGKAWWEKVEKKWKAADKVRSKRAWLDKKIQQSLATWEDEHIRAEQRTQELRRREARLKLRAQPVLLSPDARVGRRVTVEGPKEAEERAEEMVGKRAFLRARQRQPVLMWSLRPQRPAAWKTILQMAREPREPSRALKRPMAYRLPKNSLYLLARPVATQKLSPRLRRGTRHHIFRLDSKTIDWETFLKLYQSLLALKLEGGIDTDEWQEKAAQLLDLYGVSNPLVRTLMQRLLMGDYRQHKYLDSSLVKLSGAKVSLGQRILYELIHHSGRLAPKPPSLHAVLPLHYQNNVHPLRSRGVSRCGSLSMKWKTCFLKGRPSALQLYYAPRMGSRKRFRL